MTDGINKATMQGGSGPGQSAQGLSAQGLRVNIGGKTILGGVDLAVRPGELVGLIGPNGAGKSTLLRAMLGLVDPQAGTVTLDGRPADTLDPAARARRIAYAPQGAPVHWPLTVERLVGLGRVPHLGPWQALRPEDAQAVQTALAATDTLHLRKRVVTTLSGGERAGVLLARAMAVGADYLLADEPVASLDPYHQLQVMDILADLAWGGTGVVVVLHDLGLALRSCSRLCLLDAGRVVADAAPAAVLTPEHLARVYRISAVTGAQDGADYLLPWERTS